MADTGYNVLRLREMDELAALDSPIHSLHPLSKLIVTILYIAVTTSFPKYDFSGLAVMALYPAMLFALSGVSVKTCFYKMRFVLPVVCAVGIFNPFFDRAPLLHAGSVVISGGLVSMATLMVKGIFCLSASFLLVATTSIDTVFRVFRRLHVPEILVTLMLLTYRYVAVMAEEVDVLVTAYRLRAPGQRGVHFTVWGSFLGQLLLRSMDRAQEIYAGMQLRGYEGNFVYAGTRKAKLADGLFCVICMLFFLLCRYFNVAEMIGSMIL